MTGLRSILTVVMVCPLCGNRCLLRDAIPCANDGTGFGCPVEGCGGLLGQERLE